MQQRSCDNQTVDLVLTNTALCKDFMVGGLFKLRSIKQVPSGFNPTFNETGIPYLSQKTGGSYGVNGYVDEDKIELITDSMIITGVDNVSKGVMYWWDEPFYANKMVGLVNKNLNKYNAQYIITILLKQYQGFDYNNKLSMDIINDTIISLPVTSHDDLEPYWFGMEMTIAKMMLKKYMTLEHIFKNIKQ